jgi:hypothetical protein
MQRECLPAVCVAPGSPPQRPHLCQRGQVGALREAALGARLAKHRVLQQAKHLQPLIAGLAGERVLGGFKVLAEKVGGGGGG